MGPDCISVRIGWQNSSCMKGGSGKHKSNKIFHESINRWKKEGKCVTMNTSLKSSQRP